MQVNSIYEEQCRTSVLNTLGRGIPVRALQHEYCGRPKSVMYGFDTRVDCKSKGRCDIVLWLEYEGYKETICIECKTGMRDLKSGYGLNFDGDINYILYPKTASRFIRDGYWDLNANKIEEYLWQKKIFGVGILELDDHDRIRFVKRANRVHKPFGYLGICTEFGDY